MRTRKIWLQNPITKTIWDLLPDDPYKEYDGCACLGVDGFGYSQSVTHNQVGVDYFVSEVLSTNQNITGSLYFKSDEHFTRFQDFIGDFRQQFNLFYSPSGEFEPYDQISKPYYKPVLITSIGKSEKDEYGWYVCKIVFTTQSDVWRRDFIYGVENLGLVGEALVYPYVYPYVLGGRNTLLVNIYNMGRETGCTVRIKNRGAAVLSNIEWFAEHVYTDYYGVEHTEVQRAKWYTENTSVTLQQGYELYVDSTPIKQEAKVIFTDGTSQSVVNQQEPSWDYINFVQLKHGDNRFIFYVDSDEIDISVQYSELRELV